MGRAGDRAGWRRDRRTSFPALAAKYHCVPLPRIHPLSFGLWMQEAASCHWPRMSPQKESQLEPSLEAHTCASRTREQAEDQLGRQAGPRTNGQG